MTRTLSASDGLCPYCHKEMTKIPLGWICENKRDENGKTHACGSTVGEKK